MIDITKIRLTGNRIIVQELTTSQIGSIVVPVDVTHGMRALVLAVAQTDRSTLCEDIYPGDIALLHAGCGNEHLDSNVYVVNAVSVWGVIRDGEPIPINEHVMVRVDPERDDVDPDTGLWSPTDARHFPDTGWCHWQGQDWHVIYNIRGSQRRIKIGDQVYAFMDRENLIGLVEDK